MLLKQFILKTAIVVLVTTIFCVSIFHFFFPDQFMVIYATLPLIFGLINIFIFNSLIDSGTLSLIKFSNRYLFSTTLKLLGSIFFIIGFLFFNREQAIPFLSTFLVVYLIFLAQEIIGILNFFKKKEKIESTHNKT